MPAFRNVLAMIGNTPLVEVARIDTGKCRLFLKLENQNPGGSIKDRVGLYLIQAAERSGQLRAGGTLVMNMNGMTTGRVERKTRRKTERPPSQSSLLRRAWPGGSGI